MNKKLVFALLLAIFAAGSVFAQGADAKPTASVEKSAKVRNNWISGEINLFGGGVRYERMLAPKWSIGANVYYSTSIVLFDEFNAGIFGRLYPWGKTFFLELGLGYHSHNQSLLMYLIDSEGTFNDMFPSIGFGGAISPGLGWKVDVGKPGGFFVEPGISVPIALGLKKSSSGGWDEFGAGVGFLVYLGLGGCF